jgi:aminopeptidase
MAQVLTEYCAQVKKGDKVLLRGNTLAVPLVEAVFKECMTRGAHTEVILETDNLQNLFFAHAQDHQLDYTSPFLKYYIENIDAVISILADYNSKRMSNVPPQKITRKAQAQQEINTILLERSHKKELNWTLTLYPTHALAQEASMSLLEYQEFVYKACFLNTDNPIDQWRNLSKYQQKMVDYLTGKSEIHIVGEDTDITMDVSGRTWVNSDGRRNFPSGEVFTSPVEDSAEGSIRFTYPGIYMGKEIEDITLIFEQGKVVKAHAKKGDDLLQEVLTTDEGAQKLGEIAIGTNYGITQFTKNILFDEKIGGTIHAALGRSIPDAGGENMSAIHWDLIKDMHTDSSIYADGELFYENGKFVMEESHLGS